MNQHSEGTYRLLPPRNQLKSKGWLPGQCASALEKDRIQDLKECS